MRLSHWLIVLGWALAGFFCVRWLCACGGSEFFGLGPIPPDAGVALVVDVDAGDADPNSRYLDANYPDAHDVLEHDAEASEDSRSRSPEAAAAPPDAEPPPPPADAGPPPPPPVCCWDPGPDAGAAAAHPCARVTVGAGVQSVCEDGVSCVWIFAQTGSGYPGVGAACP